MNNGGLTSDDLLFPTMQDEEDFSESIRSRSSWSLVFHFQNGKPPLPINSIEESYTSNACKSVDTPGYGPMPTVHCDSKSCSFIPLFCFTREFCIYFELKKYLALVSIGRTFVTFSSWSHNNVIPLMEN